MGFLSNVRDKILKKSVGAKEKEIIKLSQGGASPAGSPYGYFEGAGTYLSEMLSVDGDLLQRYRDYEDMDEYPEISCLAGSSLVFTLDRGWRRIDDLAESGLPFYVLSYDRDLKSLVPAKASGAALTGEWGHDKPMVRVYLDDGRTIECTADHLFLNKEGSWTCAGDLEPGARLMPGVLRIRSLNVDTGEPYWQVHQPNPDSEIRTTDGKRWTWVHRLVAEFILDAEVGSGFVVHHRDEDSLNNDPSNLSLEDRVTHASHHIAGIDNSAYFPEWTAERRLAHSEKMRGNSFMRGKKLSDETRRRMSEASKGRPKSQEHRKNISLGQSMRIPREKLEAALQQGETIAEAARILGVSWSTVKRKAVEFDLLEDGNHRVIRVERLETRERVYDVTVPGYHNFVCNGVVVHNSALDIFADDATQPDSERNRTIWVTARDKRLETELNNLLHKTLMMDGEIWEIARSLCKMGNDFEEILVNSLGVRGLNFLPASTMRRVEGSRSELYGFVQDFSGRFRVSLKQFEQLLEKRLSGELTDEDVAQGVPIPFEDWEVVHFRLRSKHRNAAYGYCLVGDSRVWTPTGVKRLDEVQPGDEVYTRHAGMLRTTKVLDHVCSGTKPVFRLKTTHREVRLTAEHPMLVDRGGKNNAWVPVGELHVGDKLVAVSSQPETIGPVPLGICLRELTEDSLVRLTSKGAEALKTRNRPVAYAPTSWGLRPVARSLGLSRGVLEELLEGRSSLPLKKLRSVFQGVGLPLFTEAFDVVEDPRLRLPDFVNQKFAMLLGFLLGDGWIHGDQVCFALGEDEEQNQFYEAVFESYGLDTSRSKGHEEDVDRTSYTTCKKLVEVFAELGWAGEKAHDKRVPSWLYAQAQDIREAFLRGFLDADGGETDNGYEHIELCNEALVRDLKMLIDGLGWTCGNVRRREARTSQLKNGKEIHSGPQFTISFRKEPLSDGDFASERVESIESDGEDLVYDIEVADRSHCFVADGLVVHNSVLEAARWIWKRLVLLEDAAVLYRLQRAPERFAFYVEVGDLPPAEALAYVNRVRQQFKKKRYINPNTGKVDLKVGLSSGEDDFFVPSRAGQEGTRIEVLGAPQWQCLTGDTRVPLLDGSSPTIEELSKRKEPFWVYSIDSGGRVVPGKGYNARVSHENAKIYEVGLDNGEIVRCTGNHPFLTRDGRWVLAEDLQEGQSLMPLYRHVSSNRAGDRINGYERVYDPAKNDYVYTHHRVFEETQGSTKTVWESGSVIHHRDRRKRNNLPSNLAAVSRSDHEKEHRERVKVLHTPEVRERLRKTQATKAYRDKLRWSGDAERVEALRARNDAFNARPEVKAAASARLADYNRKADRKGAAHPRYREFSLAELRTKALASEARGIKEFSKEIGSCQRVVERSLQQEGVDWIGFAERNLKCWKPKGRGVRRNHKVSFVREVEGAHKVFDLTVEDHHNFAIEQGVFVHNSMEDLEYFLNKMFAAMKIPKAYLGKEEGVVRAVLSSEDVRFARTVLRIQRELKHGMRKVIRVHMAATGRAPDDGAYELHMTVPSAIFELAQLEVRNARADLAARMSDFVSIEWILSHIFQLSGEDISVILKQREQDAKRAMAAQGGFESVSASGASLTSDLGRNVAARSAITGVSKERLTDRELRNGLSGEEAKKKLEELLRTDRKVLNRMVELGSLLRDLKNAVH